MKEVIIAVLTVLLGGGFAAAVVVAWNERWKLKFQRQATKEDRAEEKADKTKELDQELNSIQQEEEKRNEALESRLQRIETQLSAVSEGMKLVLLDRIIQYGEFLVSKGEVTYDERKRFHDMHDCYHSKEKLNGNGDADLIVKAVNAIPMKHMGGEAHAAQS